MLDDIVIDWEKKYKDYLGTLKELRETGKGAPEEFWPLTRLEHTVIIYDLMMDEVIEKCGAAEIVGDLSSGAEKIRRLADFILKTWKKYSLEELSETLVFAVGQGYLKLQVSGGKARWVWVDYL
jgi:hypothetical protein